MSWYQIYTNALDVSQTSIVPAIILILLTFAYYWIKNRGILPGPRGLPYFGIHPFLTDENIVSKLEEYKKTYGDMYSFTYMGRLYICLNSIKAMRDIQLHKSDYFTDRPRDSNFFMEVAGNGIFSINGEPWKIFRKFFIQKFKEYGLNAVRDDLAGPLYDSLNATIEDLKIKYKTPICISDFLSKHCAITMRRIIFGENGVTDKEISTMVSCFAKCFQSLSGVNMLLIGPLGKFLMYTKPSIRESYKHSRTMNSNILKCVKRIESAMKGEEAACIVEEFYKERNERRKRNDPTWKYFTDDVLVDSLFQFVGDGIASVAVFIAGILNSLSVYPEEQEKLYSEIMEVVGPNRQPTAEDRPNMPYTNAFLNEYARTSRFLTFLPTVESSREITVRGYRIPARSIMLLNIWAAHHDEETFEDADTFKPSRYLSSPGKPKTENAVLFGMGKRICTGEPYVMLQVFLFLTTIVKEFKVVSSNTKIGNPSMDFFSDGKLELTFIPRKEV